MIRNLQKQRLLKMLLPDDPPFKILILDSRTQEILGPTLKVTDLRECGVTAHFLINNARSFIKDVPAIYFLGQSDSIQQLCKDLEKDLYGSYYLNFSLSLKRGDLEQIAAAASNAKIAHKVLHVFDQFLQFTAIQDDLFTFNINDSYINRNSVDNIRYSSNCLFSVFVTLNEVPLIFSNSKTSSEIGKALEQKIKNTKIIKKQIKRPVLIILDRDFDLITPIKHVMGYVEIINDVLGIDANKTSVAVIDVDSDFYTKNCFLDFPTVAETVNQELHNYKKELALRSLTDKSDKEKIERALESAPHLQKKSEIVNSNLNLCLKVLDEIKSRKLDDFYRIEENFNLADLPDLLDACNDRDLLRLVISLLGNPKKPNMDVFNDILKDKKIDLEIVEYFKKNMKGEEGFGSKFKGLLFKRNAPIYIYLESIYNQIKNQSIFQSSTESVFDPLSGRSIFLNEISRFIVYVNGGATYSELKALKEFENYFKIPVILGGSEILNADKFIDQIKL